MRVSGRRFGVCLTLLIVALPAFPARAAVTNGNPDRLEVWNNNVENLQGSGCGGVAWKGLVYPAMTNRTYKPDIFTVQQVDGAATGRTQLFALISEMEAKLNVDYHYVIANASPPADYPNHGCVAKRHQTNAIVYRTARLSVAPQTVWDSYRSAGCNTVNPQARTKNVGVTLTDKLAGKTVLVGSFHWPTPTDEGPMCASTNAWLAHVYNNSSSSHLNILGGDANVWPTHSTGWFGMLTTPNTYGYTNASNMPTHDTTQIDYLFARRAVGAPARIDGGETVEYPAGIPYSAHKAVRGTVYY